MNAPRTALRLAVLASVVLGLTGCGRKNTPVPVSGPGPGTPMPVISGYKIPLTGTAAVGEPESVGLMFCLDVSGSMADNVEGKRKIDISKEAMRQTFAQIDTFAQRNPKRTIKVGICSFSDRATVIQSLAPFNRTQLESAISPLQPSGGTAVGDAMVTALGELVKGGVATRGIIVMTDGASNRGTSPDQVVSAIRGNRNTAGVVTDETLIFLVAFDLNAQVFAGVKSAGAAIKESRNQQSLQDMMGLVTETVLE